MQSIFNDNHETKRIRRTFRFPLDLKNGSRWDKWLKGKRKEHVESEEDPMFWECRL
jgi:hypothetical protein